MKLFKNQKGFNDVITITIIGGIIGSLFILGVFVWKEIEVSKATNKLEQVINKIVNIKKVDKVVDKKENWKVYTNEEYRFSFKYPGDWLMENKESKINNIINIQQFLLISTTQTYPSKDRPLDAYISIYKLDNPDNKTLQEIFDEKYQECLNADDINEFGCRGAMDVSNWSDFTTNNVSSIRSGIIGPLLENDNIYIKKDGYYLVVMGMYYNLNDTYDFVPVFEKIISTFKFLETEDTSKVASKINYGNDASQKDGYRADCDSKGGKFNSCAPACPPGGICIQVCAFTCDISK